MKKVKLLTWLIIGVVIMSVVIFRIFQVNQNLEVTEVLNYNMGEEVSIGSNYFEDSTELMDGYSITANSATIYTFDDYLEKINLSSEDAKTLFLEYDDNNFPDTVYEIELTVRNNNVEITDGGINFFKYSLYGVDYKIQLSSPLFAKLNPTVNVSQGFIGFSLRPESEMKFFLPFAIRQGNKIKTIDTEKILNDSIVLPICLYPKQKQILIEATQ